MTECGLRTVVPRSFWNPPSHATWDWLQLDPIRSWQNRPGFEDRGFRIDSRGFRGPEQAADRPPGVRRLVCLGDSGTFGVWTASKRSLHFDNYPDLLRSLLEDAGEPWEVWNGGVLGYSSSTALRFFESEVVDLDPDVVSLRVGFNDHAVSDRPERVIHEPEPPWVRDLFYTLRNWRLFQLGIVVRGRWTALRREGSLTTWVPPDRFQHDLERFAEVARERDIRLLLLDYPIRALERGESPGARIPMSWIGGETLEELHAVHGRYQAIVREVAHAEGIELVETARRLARAREEVFSDYDLAHPNGEGARLIAESLRETLVAPRGDRGPSRASESR